MHQAARVDDILGELKVRRKGEGKKTTGGAKSVLHDDKVEKLKAKIHMPFDTNTFQHVLFTVCTCFFWGVELNDCTPSPINLPPLGEVHKVRVCTRVKCRPFDVSLFRGVHDT